MTACAVVPSIEHPAPQPQPTPNKAPVSSLKKLTVFPPSLFIREEMLLISSNCEATAGYVIMRAVRRRLSDTCLLHIIPSPDRKYQQGSTGERRLATPWPLAKVVPPALQLLMLLPKPLAGASWHPSLSEPVSHFPHPRDSTQWRHLQKRPLTLHQLLLVGLQWERQGGGKKGAKHQTPSENGSALGR